MQVTDRNHPFTDRLLYEGFSVHTIRRDRNMNNGPLQCECIGQPSESDHTQPIYEMTPGFRTFHSFNAVYRKFYEESILKSFWRWDRNN